jgi:hypothetical protein
MNSIRELLNPGWVSSLVGLAGLVAAILIYRASLVGARPVYQLRALRLLGPDEKALPEEVEVRFKGQAVDRLTKTHIVFWNSGKALVRGSDIVKDDLLRCEFSEGSRVLEARVLKVTPPTNKFGAETDSNVPSKVVLTFDYLDPNDGAVVEILHTDTKRYPDIKGTVRGVPKGIVDWGRIPPLRSRALRFPFSQLRTFLYAAIAVGLLTFAVGALLPRSHGSVDVHTRRTTKPGRSETGPHRSRSAECGNAPFADVADTPTLSAKS